MSRCFLGLFALLPLAAQNITLTGAGYADPTVLRVAPGQVVTLFAAGLQTVLPNFQAQAATNPLPTTLAGISVILNQFDLPSRLVPLLSIRQLPLCAPQSQAPPAPSCLLTAITVQIPFELVVLQPLNPALIPTGIVSLSISENNGSSQATRITPVTDNIHILTTCDVSVSNGTSVPCQPIATHASGTLITAKVPAQPGEEIVLWAYGLGSTSPAVPTGAASPTPAAVLAQPLTLGFDFTPNASPSRPYINPLLMTAIAQPAPDFAGLAPGQFGLYQINVRIPAYATYSPACPAVASNLTINLAGPSSFDGAPICVQPNP
jgi:uncharacterized protein (TIGR03437 family)